METITENIAEYSFEAALNKHNLHLKPLSLETLQINITKLCNQACLHCHVDSSPKRTEQMDERTVARVLEILAAHESIKKLDITGGAPELNPYFDFVVKEARKLGKHVMVRHNLTVQFDGNPQTGESKAHLPEFFAEQGVEVISSLPYYQEFFTDKQRGLGVFKKSIEAMRRLNDVGYGKPGSDLMFNLVYNPVGAFLPAAQASLEADYKRELQEKFGLTFNSLFTITNMPIHRFAESLKRRGGYEEYMEKLVNAFNPSAAEGVMCRSLISVSYDGRLYDCDFNQMLEMHVTTGVNGSSRPRTIFDFDASELLQRNILFDTHCYGCTAGAGSSCGGATA
ncbi:MAG: radical SAM/Cys-rich domain protein [Candidatus Kapaibacterium sp.]|nr:MAG: radical SAM/Cys-rich domain protein [Candidatus Kapabacteria bacterium]